MVCNICFTCCGKTVLHVQYSIYISCHIRITILCNISFTSCVILIYILCNIRVTCCVIFELHVIQQSFFYMVCNQCSFCLNFSDFHLGKSIIFLIKINLTWPNRFQQCYISVNPQTNINALILASVICKLTQSCFKSFTPYLIDLSDIICIFFIFNLTYFKRRTFSIATLRY